MNIGIDHYKQPHLDISRARIRRPHKPDAYDALWDEFIECLKRRDFERAGECREVLKSIEREEMVEVG